jgi:hypothetical protein
MKNDGLRKKQDLIQEYYFKLQDLASEKTAITKTINVMKERFEELIKVEEDLDQLCLFENMDEFLKERSQKVLGVKTS